MRTRLILIPSLIPAKASNNQTSFYKTLLWTSRNASVRMCCRQIRLLKISLKKLDKEKDLHRLQIRNPTSFSLEAHWRTITEARRGQQWPLETI